MESKSKVIEIFKRRGPWSICIPILIMLFSTVIISGCGGGGGGGGAMLSPESFLEGVFIDSPVEGLEYETSTRTGMTDENGTFMYQEGDTIRFYVGDVVLGEAAAKSMMTPVDLVDGATDETHPAVVNMARFLQTMDDDMNPENGITITETMANAMTDHMVDFDMPTIEFENDVNVMMAIDAMNNIDMSASLRMMVSAQDARSHLSDSIMDMTGEGYMMGINSSGPLLEGTFIDSPVEGLEYETATRTGMTDADGTFMYHEGETMRFYVGDIMLGEAMATSMMTPIDLVDGATDETHPAVINMTRFLQTMDDDMNPENGIMITETMSNAMVDHMIDFNMDPDDFEYDSNVMTMMDTINDVDSLNYMRMMVSAEDAIDHFSNSMNDMMTDCTMYDGGMMSSGGGMM